MIKKAPLSIENKNEKNISLRNLSLGMKLVILLLTIGPILFSFVCSPDKIENKRGAGILVPPCLFKTLFGIPCPSCGMSRAFCSISRCEFRKACQYNLLSLPIYLFFLIVASRTFILILLELFVLRISKNKSNKTFPNRI